jgi:hypothetical protein
MSCLHDLLAEMGAKQAAEICGLIDGWAAEVLKLQSESLSPAYMSRGADRWTLDDLFGSYRARDRLARFTGSAELLVVRSIDSLLVTFTEDLGRSWLTLTGLEDSAGNGWWWSRVPVHGPIRDEINRSTG